jgi:nucleoside 2-deoxyribosyltransferase
MIVAGGLYRERCLVPEWNHLYGSGGRAAAALALHVPGIELATYCEEGLRGRAELLMGMSGVGVRMSTSQQTPTFEYFHPLSRPDMHWSGHAEAPFEVDGDTVLRFGMLEGDARVTAKVAVFDPQSSGAGFRMNGSRTERLATILNEQELVAATELADRAKAASQVISQGSDTDIVVVKRGAAGAEVYGTVGLIGSAPAYRSDRVFKIGSGDIFSAAFAFHWAVEGRAPEAAADLASRSVAHYVAARTLPLPPAAELQHGAPLPPTTSAGRVYLAGPFFSLSERWLIEEARSVLLGLGCQVFSPLHEIGFGAAEEVAPRDLAGLDTCSAVLAILDGRDPGTLFEVGHARSKGIPVVGLAENVLQHDLTMPLGTGCEIVNDFTTAAYRAAWAAMR